MYTFLTVMMLGIVLCVQEFLPRLGPGAYHGVILLFPVWFLCTAVTLPYPIMLGVAFFAGLLWDLRYVVDPGAGVSGFPDVPTLAVTPVGVSIFFFGVLGSMMHGVKPLYKKRQMGFPILLTGAGIFLFRLFDYLFLNFKRGDIQFPQLVFHEICATAVLSMIFSPFIYYVLSSLSRALLGGFRFAHGR